MTKTTQAHDELLAENIRLKSMGQKATLFVVAIVVLCALTVIGIVTIHVMRPAQDNTAITTAIIGITAPLLISMLAAAVQQVHLAVNSRLSQLLEITAASSQAKGTLIEKEEAKARHRAAGT